MTFLSAAEQAVTSGVDLSRMLALADAGTPEPEASELFPAQAGVPKGAIAVARDQVFSFYYQDGLDLLEAWGAELVPFSPLTDSVLPQTAPAVYIVAGLPDLFPADLARNLSVHESLLA